MTIEIDSLFEGRRKKTKTKGTPKPNLPRHRSHLCTLRVRCPTTPLCVVGLGLYHRAASTSSSPRSGAPASFEAASMAISLFLSLDPYFNHLYLDLFAWG